MSSEESKSPTPPDQIDFYRADGRCLCPVCNKEYYKHPFSEHQGWDGPYLHKLCNGDLVKL